MCSMGRFRSRSRLGEWPSTRNCNNPIEIAFMSPHTIVPSQPTLVQFHFGHRDCAPGQACRDDMRLVGRQGREVVAIKEIDSTTNMTSLTICSEKAGLLEFSVEKLDGTPLSKTGCMVALPEICCEELSRVWEDCLEGVRQSMPMGLGDASDPWLIAKIGWRDYFRHLLRDLGQILQIVLYPEERNHRSLSDSVMERKIQGVLVFFLDNMAYKTGDFMLKAAVRSGHPVRLESVRVNEQEIDLETMIQRFHPSSSSSHNG